MLVIAFMLSLVHWSGNNVYHDIKWADNEQIKRTRPQSSNSITLWHKYTLMEYIIGKFVNGIYLWAER